MHGKPVMPPEWNAHEHDLAPDIERYEAFNDVHNL